jgi:hypothetical protein
MVWLYILIAVYVVVGIFCLVSSVVKISHVYLADAMLVYFSELVLTLLVSWLVYIITGPRDCTVTQQNNKRILDKLDFERVYNEYVRLRKKEDKHYAKFKEEMDEDEYL